jgi:acyl dehydratase
MPEKPLSALEEMVGSSVETVRDLHVEAGKVAEFAGAITDDSEVFRDSAVADERGLPGIPAPLTFTRTAYFDRYRPEGIGPDLGFDLGFDREYVVHGEQEYEFERPVYVGDTLSGKTTLEDVYQREGSRGGKMTFAVLRTDFTDESGDLVVIERITRIETAGAIEESEEGESKV